jgi:hypothetical protein
MRTDSGENIAEYDSNFHLDAYMQDTRGDCGLDDEHYGLLEEFLGQV